MVRDHNGNMHQHQYWEVVFEDEQYTPSIILRDSSGAVWVMPDGAEFLPERSLRDAPGARGYRAPQQSVAGQVLDALSFIVSSGYEHHSRYRTSEWVVPVGLPCYVLGGMVRYGDQARMAAGGSEFIISCESEEELSRKFRRDSLLWTGSGMFFIAGGIALKVIGAVKK